MSYPNTHILEYLRTLFNNDSEGKDVTIKSNDQEVKAHKIFLCANPVIKEKLANGGSLNVTAAVSVDALTAFASYFYNDLTNTRFTALLQKKKIHELLKLSYEFAEKELEKYCLDALRNNIAHGTVLHYLECVLGSIAYITDEDLIRQCWSYLDQNFIHVIETRGFTFISPNLLKILLERKLSTLVDPTRLFNRLVQWRNYHTNVDQTVIKNLFGYVNYANMSPFFLVTVKQYFFGNSQLHEIAPFSQDELAVIFGKVFHGVDIEPYCYWENYYHCVPTNFGRSDVVKSVKQKAWMCSSLIQSKSPHIQILFSKAPSSNSAKVAIINEQVQDFSNEKISLFRYYEFPVRRYTTIHVRILSCIVIFYLNGKKSYESKELSTRDNNRVFVQVTQDTEVAIHQFTSDIGDDKEYEEKEMEQKEQTEKENEELKQLIAKAKYEIACLRKDLRDTFKLDPSTIKGTYLTISSDGFTATKSATSHCAVCSATSFQTGTHSWTVKLGARTSFAGEYWILLGVHKDPKNVKCHPSGDPGAYGVSVHGNANGWRVTAGATVYNPTSVLRQVNPGETVTVILDCDNHKISFQHARWNDYIDNLPPNIPYWPFFDPYDLEFTVDI